MSLTLIPFIDLRGKTPVDLLTLHPDRARALVGAARDSYGIISRVATAMLFPFADRLSYRWLEHTQNPYLEEINEFSRRLGMRGVTALNVAYEWGCTTGAWKIEEGVSLFRVLDWPFPALGKLMVVTLQEGKAGTFYNVTWPGVSGVYTAMAVGRFAGAINQAPMRRHALTFAGDWVANRVKIRRESGLPPSHLLRHVMENAKDYEEAKQMLYKIPVALPVIYTLTGLNAAEGCVIERLENAAEVREIANSDSVSTSNHFHSRFDHFGQGWWPRAVDSHGRFEQSCLIPPEDIKKNHFEWVSYPVMNELTRLCVLTDAATGRLVVQGFEDKQPITQLFELDKLSYVPEQAA